MVQFLRYVALNRQCTANKITARLLSVENLCNEVTIIVSVPVRFIVVARMTIVSSFLSIVGIVVVVVQR